MAEGGEGEGGKNELKGQREGSLTTAKKKLRKKQNKQQQKQ